jgi:uncharacterized MAPEG superfamily protein
MTTTLSPELYYLILITGFTAVMWIPYILDRLVRNGFAVTLGFIRDREIIATPWAARAKAAHANAVENLVVFAPTVIVAHLMAISTPLTVLAAMVYCAVRVAHYFIYLLGIPLLRTLSFAAGWAAQLVFVAALLGLRP